MSWPATRRRRQTLAPVSSARAAREFGGRRRPRRCRRVVAGPFAARDRRFGPRSGALCQKKLTGLSLGFERWCVVTDTVGLILRVIYHECPFGLIFLSPESPRRAHGGRPVGWPAPILIRNMTSYGSASSPRIGAPAEPSFRRSRSALGCPATPRSRLESDVARSNRGVAPEPSHRPQRGQTAHATDAAALLCHFALCAAVKKRARGAQEHELQRFCAASVALVEL